MAPRNFISELCEEEGLSTSELRKAATVILRALHKSAYCGDEVLWGTVRDCWFEFGGEAAFHLGGILEIERLQSDADIPWSELFLRLDPDGYKTNESKFISWKNDRSPNRKLIDGDSGRSLRVKRW